MSSIEGVSVLVSPSTPTSVHYLPIATTVLSTIFLVILLRRYMTAHSGPHLLL